MPGTTWLILSSCRNPIKEVQPSIPLLIEVKKVAEQWLKLGSVCLHSVYFKTTTYPCDGMQVLCDLACSPLQPHLFMSPFLLLMLQLFEPLLCPGPWHAVSHFCLCFCTQVPSSLMPCFLCLSCGMSRLSRFISSVNSSMNLSSTPPLLGGIYPSTPCVSLIRATTTLSYPYMDKDDSPILDFYEFLKCWDHVLLIHFIHSI